MVCARLRRSGERVGVGDGRRGDRGNRAMRGTENRQDPGRRRDDRDTRGLGGDDEVSFVVRTDRPVGGMREKKEGSREDRLPVPGLGAPP